MGDVIDCILDGNLDRAREGLRVLEEWCRFGRRDPEWTERCKAMRHTLAAWHGSHLVRARNTPADVGTDLSHPQEEQRRDPEHLLQANCGRVQEALRVIEEYGKLSHPELAQAAKQMRYQVYTLQSWLWGSPRHQRLASTRLYLVTMPVPHWLTQVEGSLQGGVRLVQYRLKEGSDRDRVQDALSLRALCDRYGALLIINDRVDIALMVKADGVHLGQTDAPVDAVRRLLGSDKIIGQSTTNREELAIALANKVDYIGVGPVYPTPTKAGKAAAGWDYVRHVAEQVTIPWFAIGGIDQDNVSEVMHLGHVSRVAVVRSLMQAQDPVGTAQQMLAHLGSRQ
ncbi:MAG: thiamine phosphate synthase [Synechococcales cyanobacterium]